MPRWPLYKAPVEVDPEAQSLAGYEACGCISAAFSVKHEPTEAQVRRFYSDMAQTGREVRWTDDEVIRTKLFGTCKEQHGG